MGGLCTMAQRSASSAIERERETAIQFLPQTLSVAALPMPDG